MRVQSRPLILCLALVAWVAVAHGETESGYGQCPAPDKLKSCKQEDYDNDKYPMCCESKGDIRGAQEGQTGARYYSLQCNDELELKPIECVQGCYNGKCNSEEASKEVVKGGACRGLEDGLKCKTDDFSPTCCDPNIAYKRNKDEEEGEEMVTDTYLYVCDDDKVRQKTCPYGCSNGKCNDMGDEKGEMAVKNCNELEEGDKCTKDQFPMCCPTKGGKKRNGKSKKYSSITCTDDGIAIEACSDGCATGLCNVTGESRCAELQEGTPCDGSSYEESCCEIRNTDTGFRSESILAYRYFCNSGSVVNKEECPDGCSGNKCG